MPEIVFLKLNTGGQSPYLSLAPIPKPGWPKVKRPNNNYLEMAHMERKERGKNEPKFFSHIREREREKKKGS